MILCAVRLSDGTKHKIEVDNVETITQAVQAIRDSYSQQSATVLARVNIEQEAVFA